ncbi:MAG: hypothetical protein K6B65_02805 [Bacilli bacterium]|nr:hypothetical protein [Bacilli bacterium]
MTVYKNRLTPYKDFTYQGELDLGKSLGKKDYRPLLGVNRCEVDVAVYLGDDDHIYCDYGISATLVLEDSRTLEPFEEEVSLSDSVEILPSPLEEGEGYIFEGSSFELEELILAIMKSSLPIAPKKEGSELPPSTEDYDVYVEGEEKDEEGFVYRQEPSEDEEA